MSQISTSSSSSSNPNPNPTDTVPLGEASKSVYFQRTGVATVLPYTHFDVKKDVDDLIKAFERPDKDAIIEILCNRSMQQRLEIADFYEHITTVELTKTIKNLFHAKVVKLMIGLAMPYYAFLAHTIYHSQSFRWLYYILFTIPNQEIILMKEYFFAKYHQNVENFICKSKDVDPNGDEEQQERVVIGPLMKMLRARRSEDDEVDEKDVLSDVEKLEHLNGSYFDDSYQAKQIVKVIFHNKSFAHIKAICEEYSRQNGGEQIQHHIVKADTFSFGNDNIYDCFIKFSMSPVYYFSYALKKSMQNLGTNDRLLSHIVVRRCEIDMVDIKEEFLRLYGESLRMWIKRDCSKHYKYALYKLIGEERSYKK